MAQIKITAKTWHSWTKKEQDFFIDESERRKNFYGVSYYKTLFSAAKKHFSGPVEYLGLDVVKYEGKIFYYSQDRKEFIYSK
jgi:hypothetical protein